MTPETELEDNIKSALASNPALRDKILDLLTSRDTYWKERVREIIKCKRCNGQGGYLGASLGYSECEDCGGDGHCLYNREEEKLDTLLDNLK